MYRYYESKLKLLKHYLLFHNILFVCLMNVLSMENRLLQILFKKVVTKTFINNLTSFYGLPAHMSWTPGWESLFYHLLSDTDQFLIRWYESETCSSQQKDVYSGSYTKAGMKIIDTSLTYQQKKALEMVYLDCFLI